MTKTYWPGTAILKSQGNAFTNWKEDGESVVLKDWGLRNSDRVARSRANSPGKAFTIYSKARAAK